MKSKKVNDKEGGWKGGRRKGTEKNMKKLMGDQNNRFKK